ncbi:RNA-binding protein 42-like [Schistocerca gregaria]|uniref:RNA-binding protein 42-like n=1 Tax=Schistocerca gregaria TaxID=7010 RepID=UPI00211E732F|nr:RNA-binding protein 42-like [Schistocerca gregaria]
MGCKSFLIFSTIALHPPIASCNSFGSLKSKSISGEIEKQNSSRTRSDDGMASHRRSSDGESPHKRQKLQDTPLVFDTAQASNVSGTTLCRGESYDLNFNEYYSTPYAMMPYYYPTSSAHPQTGYLNVQPTAHYAQPNVQQYYATTVQKYHHPSHDNNKLLKKSAPQTLPYQQHVSSNSQTSKDVSVNTSMPKILNYGDVDPLAPPINDKKRMKPRTVYRKAGGKIWQDPSLLDWPEGDFRIFVGNLGNEVDDATLQKAFSKYPTLAKWRVIRDPYQNTKGFGFVSFLDPHDGVKALKEMNGRYIGQRPCKLTKSNHEERNLYKNKS